MQSQQHPERGSIAYLVLISLVAALGGLLFGYDTAVISGAIGFLQTHFELTPAMKGWAASSALLGCVVGVVLAGPISDGTRLKRVGVAWAICVALWVIHTMLSLVGGFFETLAAPWVWSILALGMLCWLGLAAALGETLALVIRGRKQALLLSAVLFLVSAIGTALPTSFEQFVIFRIIGGVGVGIASMTSPMYIAEISPARIRGRMVSVNQFAIVSGMLVVYFVNFFIAGQGDESWNITTGWRWMFGSEALPALLLFVLMLLVPESPRFLTKRGREDKARRILARIDGDAHADREMTEIKSALASESGSLKQLLKPGMRVVLVIGVLLAVLQQVTGINVFLYYAPEILKSVAGSGTDVALLQTVLVGAVNLLFTVLAIWVVDKVGRKPLMIIGATGMGISLAAIGLASWAQVIGPWLLVFMLGYIACFAMSVGPVTWVILSEIFPTRIRGRALGIATLCLWVANFIVSQTFPMMDENPALIARFHHGFPFLIYAAFCVVLVLVMIRLVPETKGRSLEEIERMWIKRR